MAGYQAFPVLNQQFIVDRKYQFIREMGQGAYGVVWYVYKRELCYFVANISFSLLSAAKDTESDEQVAIKKVSKI